MQAMTTKFANSFGNLSWRQIVWATIIVTTITIQSDHDLQEFFTILRNIGKSTNVLAF